MCGICGFTGHIDKSDKIIKKMADVITHRGPDSEGFYCDKDISMGFRRLSIIDLSGGDQPIYNDDKTKVLTFNGEIYNYKELRSELISLGHKFSTNTDSEVILQGYEAWGEKVLDRLRGMFGFAIYNLKDDSLFIARDFFGIKPVHYALVGDHFVYGSEIKSILEFPLYEKKFNAKALDTYLSFQYVLPPETFFEGVYCLLPGHFLRYKNGKITTQRYFEPTFSPDEALTEDDAADKIEKVFEESVNAHKISDVEVGCFLSSGVDSSYVSSYFAGQKTFTVGFDFGEKYNETDWAKELSEKIGVEHHSKIISSDEFWANIEKVQYYMDQPLADPSCIALYFVSKLASEYVKVVLSGEGADELFGGYTIYNEINSLKAYQKLPAGIRKMLADIVRPMPKFKGRSFIIRGANTVEKRFIGNAFMFDKTEKQMILKTGLKVSEPYEYTKKLYDRVSDYDDITKMQYLDINTWMVGDILLKADRMSMANSLELRVPFLDKEVFSVARTIPSRLRVNRKNTKYAMRKAAHRHIPEEWAKKKKLGFPVPTRVWLRDEKYYNIVKAAFNSETAKKIFNSEKLIKYLDDHYKGKEDNSRKIWTVYIFIVWYNIYFGISKISI
ncbi:MAG: asparagine synthase (glutamine-hydrolyzing) [Clostridia bacterium]|nr:asparagine synthase (glutamine-hydrolyzing) [Clostridia bacterium]